MPVSASQASVLIQFLDLRCKLYHTPLLKGDNCSVVKIMLVLLTSHE